MKRLLLICLIALCTGPAAYGQFVPFELPARKRQKPPPPPPRSPSAPAEPTAPEQPPAPAPPGVGEPEEAQRQTADLFRNPFDELRISFSAGQIGAWRRLEVNGRSCLVSPAIGGEEWFELNHHRITVDFVGGGRVEVGIAHSSRNDIEYVLSKKHLRRPFKKVESGREVTLTSPYKGETCAWIMVPADDSMKIKRIDYRALRGRGTLYGHSPARFQFAGVALPYRLMAPKYVDPNERYPLVVTVGGSASIGTDNRKNMEMVGMPTYLFRQYFDDGRFACYSIAPQILPDKARPAPYWPRGQRGAPTQAHPDLPLVNADGWYTQATLALIRRMLADPAYRIDPDRIYLTGFSYGGKGVWEFLRAAPDMFAAAISCSGWAIGRLNADPSPYLRNMLIQEAQPYKHVPILVTAGEKDARMAKGSRCASEVLNQIGGNCTYVEFPQTDHVPSAGKTWGNRQYIEWLFEQKKNLPATVAN